MKQYLFLSFLFIFSTSCVDVINIDLPTETPRLVVEASLDWEKGTAGNVQSIRLSLSTPFFETTTPSVENAVVTVIKNDDSTTFTFAHQNNGIYTTNNFIPEMGKSYTLTILYNNETYTATETLLKTPEITSVYQSIESGFDEELTEIKVTFNDPVDEENNYLVKFTKQNDDVLFPAFNSFDDEFRNGNEITTFYERDIEDSQHQNFKAGDVVDIDFYAISKQYYNYISLLLEQSEEDNLFSTVPFSLGNCINLTDSNKYAYGYFRVTEVEKKSYTIQ